MPLTREIENILNQICIAYGIKYLYDLSLSIYLEET